MKKNESVENVVASENSDAKPLPMKIDVKIGSIRPTGSIRAIASVNLNECFAIRNVKIIEGSKGLFVSMPSYRAGNGEYKDICFPVTADFRKQLNNAVINEYQNTLQMSQKQIPVQDDLSFEQNTGLKMK